MAEQNDNGIEGTELVDGKLEVTLQSTEQMLAAMYEPVETPPKLVNPEIYGAGIKPSPE